MTIPESQLDPWSGRGADASAKKTADSIKTALTRPDTALSDKSVEIYLQGSYANDTNIRADSDVDVVVQLNSTFQYDLSLLSENEKQRHNAVYANTDYGFGDFRRDVLSVLRAYYGPENITEGNKSLKIAANSGRLPADVIPCLQYRKYSRFQSTSDQNYVEGIQFQTQKEKRWVINYPKEHYKNGVEKNSDRQTQGWFKPTVRVFKNARSYMRDKGILAKGEAPSYFIQCLLYNVPSSLYGITYNKTFFNILDWLNKADMEKFVCQNGQVYLFGDSPEQWSVVEAKKFLRVTIELWNNW